MPAPPARGQDRYCGGSPTGYAAGLYTLRDTVAATDTTDTQVQVEDGSEESRVWVPRDGGGLSADGAAWRNAGWVIPLANWTPTDARGRAFIPAGSYEVAQWVLSSNSTVVLAQNQMRPEASLWRYRPSDGATEQLGYALAASASDVPAGLVGSPAEITVAIGLASDVLFERDEVLALQIGGRITTAGPLLGSNTATYSLHLTVDAPTGVQIATPGPRIFLQEAGAAVGECVASTPPKSVAKPPFVASGVAVGSFDRSWQAHRSFQAIGRGVGADPRKAVSVSLQFDGAGEAIRSGKVTKTPLGGAGKGVASRANRARIGLESVGEAEGVLERSWMAYRNFQAIADGEPDLSRVVIFTREFEAVGVGKLSPRIDMSFDDVPDGGAGGTIINYNSLYVFDD